MDVIKIHRQETFTISVRQVENYQAGRTLLVGDAAHCHSPVGGRGMNLGIADAADLAQRKAEDNFPGYSGTMPSLGRRLAHTVLRG